MESITTEVEIVSQGEHKPESVFDALQPDNIELLFKTWHFAIYKLSFGEYTSAHEITLLRAHYDHEISDYVSIDVRREHGASERAVSCDECGETVLERDAVLVESGKNDDVYQCARCAEEEGQS